MKDSPDSCNMLVRLWNTNEQCWDKYKVDVPGKPQKGPRDEYLTVIGMKVKPDKDGNFINPDFKDRELDAVHAFAVARLTIDLWEQALGQKIKWAWNIPFLPLRLRIDLYDPSVSGLFKHEQCVIKFGCYGSRRMHTSKSFDIVSHETTHAIIHSIRRNKNDKRTIEHRAVIEALCDISPILLLLSIPKFLDKALTDTNGNLRNPSFISEFAEGFTQSRKAGIRSALSSNDIESELMAIQFKIVNVVFEQTISILEHHSYDQFYHLFSQQVRKLILPVLHLEKFNYQSYMAAISN